MLVRAVCTRKSLIALHLITSLGTAKKSVSYEKRQNDLSLFRLPHRSSRLGKVVLCAVVSSSPPSLRRAKSKLMFTESSLHNVVAFMFEEAYTQRQSSDRGELTGEAVNRKLKTNCSSRNLDGDQRGGRQRPKPRVKAARGHQRVKLWCCQEFLGFGSTWWPA